MLNTWLVLLPPVVILVAALITKRLNISLILGIIAASLIASRFSLAESASLLASRLLNQMIDPDNLYLYGFLLILGVIISLFEYNGAAMAFAHRLTKHLKSGIGAQKTALLLSTTLFIDDYLSCLTTGYVMRPITDRFAIARVKLAFLIHSFSGPLVILAPISSWIALITSQLEKAGVSRVATSTTRIVADPFYMYLQSIPYIFYSLILIASVWFIVLRKISFGPMHTQEEIAHKTGNLFGGKTPLESTNISLKTNKGFLSDLVIPLAVLIVTFILGILWAGNYKLFGGNNTFLEALQNNTQTSLALLVASIITLVAAIILSSIHQTFSMQAFPLIAKHGVQMMYSAMLMVFLASTLGVMLRSDLQTGDYLAQVLQGNFPIALFPLLFFGIAIITALITGSAWGTIALMIPIAVQMITSLASTSLPATPTNIPLLLPILGAIFSGAVCGNHVSPIAETTIMSSNSAGCYPLDHSNTQFWYTLPIIIATAIAFLLIGLLLPYGSLISITISLVASIGFSLVGLTLANRFFRN